MRLSVLDVIYGCLIAVTPFIIAVSIGETPSILLPVIPVAALAKINPFIVFVISGFMSYFVASSFLYRMFHFYPLLLPKCPLCRHRDRNYQTLYRNWPMEIIECENCHAHVELCCDSMKC